MGCGTWDTDSFRSYSTSKGLATDKLGFVTSSVSNQEMFKARDLDPALDPKDVIRECCDSDDHPNTLPVILALDVTGSMGQAAVEVAKKLNSIMTKLYENIKDVEFMIMGIGDLSCDYYPIQVSQFESDIRIAEQLDKIYFEFGGGGNMYESYTAAWYFGLHHTKIYTYDGNLTSDNYRKNTDVVFEFDYRHGEDPKFTANSKKTETKETWGISNGFSEVVAIIPSPNMWGENPYKRSGEHTFFLLKDCKDMTGGIGRGFFTEMLKGDLQEIRKTLEAYTASTPIEGEDEASACGVGYSKDKEWNLIIKVTNGNTVKMIKVDRFD